ncbi:MAG: TetR/AcrR family transcriptional regulator [Actinomycetota bacterium]|nr:TetR/AcrR family transcriptional regulator [Actinomycetota bacterium]MDQ2955766.1 TetR/AcrR family transcriptional regulator [Actinomycetota bacterium]
MPKVVDYDQRRREIIDVTWNLIVEGGLDAATMREIAAAAGFANGALKHYFPSKDVIIEATYQRALGFMNDHVAQAVGDRRGLAALQVLCRETLPIDQERANAGRVLLAFWATSLSHPQLYEAYREHLKAWRAVLRKYLRQGRQDGDILTRTPDSELVDEIVLMNAGANVMVVVGPNFSTVAMQLRHLDSFFQRLGRP